MEVPFSMAIGNEKLMHECFPEHSHMGTAIMHDMRQSNRRKRLEEDVSIEKNNAGTK